MKKLLILFLVILGGCNLQIRGVVTGKKIKPQHTEFQVISTGNTGVITHSETIPDTHQLQINTGRGQTWLNVSKEKWEAIEIGDTYGL